MSRVNLSVGELLEELYFLCNKHVEVWLTTLDEEMSFIYSNDLHCENVWKNDKKLHINSHHSKSIIFDLDKINNANINKDRTDIYIQYQNKFSINIVTN